MMLLGRICKTRAMLHPEHTTKRTDVDTVAQGIHSSSALHIAKM